MQEISKQIYKKSNELVSDTSATISLSDIKNGVENIFSGRSIKIMNSIGTEDNDCFVLKNKSFVLLVSCNHQANAFDITDDLFVDLMANFYACRALSFDRVDRSKKIFELSRNNDIIIRKIMIKSDQK